MDVDTHCAELAAHLGSAMEEAFPRPKEAPRASWISEATWELILARRRARALERRVRRRTPSCRLALFFGLWMLVRERHPGAFVRLRGNSRAIGHCVRELAAAISALDQQLVRPPSEGTPRLGAPGRAHLPRGRSRGPRWADG